MNRLARTATALAVAAWLPAQAQSNAELLKELQALKDRVLELEKKLQAAGGAAPAAGQWGMTPEQARELNRVTVKAEAMQDAFTDQGYKGLKISGAIDPTVIWNRRQNDASFVLLNHADARYTYDNSYFGMAVLDLEKETDSGTRWKLTLAPDRGTGSLINGRSIVHEASVSIPLTDLQTRLWLGQIPDWTGYEYTMPKDNKLITHNLLFDTMAPTAYTGAALDLKSGKWWTRVGLANVNTARRTSGNTGTALIYRVDYSRGEFQGWGLTGLHGQAPNFAADGTWRRATGELDHHGEPVFEDAPFAEAGKDTTMNLFEFDAYFVRGDWSWFGQASWGMQKKAAIFNSDGVLRTARWWGLSSTLAYKVTPRFETVARADFVYNKRHGGGLLGYSFDDGINGIGRGLLADGSFAKGESVGANRWALSLGANYLFDEFTIFKLEFRHDGASQPVFADQHGQELRAYRKTNQLLGASVVVKF